MTEAIDIGAQREASNMRDDLLKTVDRICDAHCDRTLREAAEAGEWPAALWRALEEVGLTRAALPERAGGFGFAFEDAMAALRRCAYHALPVPIAETMLAGRLLAAAGLPVPDGPLTVAPTRTGDRLAFSRRATGTVVTGVAHRVPWGGHCAATIVAGEFEGRCGIGIVANPVSAGRDCNLAGEPRSTLSFDATPLVAYGSLDDAFGHLQAEGALVRSVQLTGALERALEYGLRYANDRIQFGRPIAKFQAVQHMLAVMAGHVAAASAAADAAVEVSCERPDMFAIAVAKSRVGEAAGRSAEIAHQVHGAMGYTREHALHYTTRRLWSWRDEFGSESQWQSRLGEWVAAGGGAALWPMLTEQRPDWVIAQLPEFFGAQR